MIKKICIFILICLSVFNINLEAGNTPTNNDLINTVVKTNYDQIIEILFNKTISSNVKQAKVNTVFNDLIDFNVTTKLSVGRTYWSTLSKQQQEAITQSFKRYLQIFYTRTLLRISNEKIIFKEAIKKKNKATVPMIVHQGDITYKNIFKLYDNNDRGWKIYDLEVNGISLIRIYRAQFNRYLSQPIILSKEQFDNLGSDYAAVYSQLINNDVFKKHNELSAILVVKRASLSSKLGFLEDEKKIKVIELLTQADLAQSQNNVDALIKSLQ